MVELAGAKPVIVDTREEDDYQVTGDLLKKYITSKTKGIILNYPSNPVGSVYTVENLTQIGKLAVEHDLYIISDEMYEKLVYDGYKHTSIASIDNAFKERTIISNGVSKAYSMTGWRIGYTVGTERDYLGHVKHPESKHVKPDVYFSVCCPGSTDRPPGFHRHDGR